MTNFFAAIDSGNGAGAVYGLGETHEEAIADARAEGADGNLQVVPCSDLAAHWIQEQGGAPDRELLVGPEGVCRLGEN